MDKKLIQQGIIESGKRLYGRNLLAAADGNISYRISDSEILITPSGLPKAQILPQDICTISIDNKILSGQPSSERLMHLEIYKSCPKANCVVHAHPPTAVAWTIAQPESTEIPSDCLAETILAAGRIPVIPYARPSTKAMGDNLKPFLPEHRLMVLARHGAVAWGESLTEAVNGIERLEHVCQMLQSAMAFGGLKPLPDEEIEALKEMRKQIGEKLI
jgi:L-fuculose-phosphate aldolase